MNMIVIYEVNVFVQRDIESEYREWLLGHIEEIIALPGFLDAHCFDVQQEATADSVAICMQYRLESQAALDDYFARHAPRLRADGIDRFGDRFKANRRVLINGKDFTK
ncbi:MAG: DUF4286 family protein [Arenimonas sp.]